MDEMWRLRGRVFEAQIGSVRLRTEVGTGMVQVEVPGIEQLNPIETRKLVLLLRQATVFAELHDG